MKRSFLYSLVCMLLLGVTACVDHEIRPFDDMPEGETTVSATIEFNSMVPALETRAVAGDAIKDIESLCVLVYGVGKDDTYFKKYTVDDLQNYKVSDYPRKGDTIAETSTKKATFQLKLPYGLYYIYAVANMGNLDNYDVSTIEKLKSISVDWNAADIRKNNQMFGHFTEANVYSSDPYQLKINRKGMTLRAGIRRLASKVTLAFDGSNLKEGVFVHIKSVKIKDIPKSCSLKEGNAITDKDLMIADGDSIVYVEPETYPYDETYPVRITKGKPYYPYIEKEKEKVFEKNFHTEKEEALFFYENMQGEGKDKRQKKEEIGADGKLPYVDKDDMPYGTYIEVEAYYRSINGERLGEGDIKYRFMLGNNITTDYNAERNHHYKLTMKFKNFANDVDWHIDYEEEEPSIQVPDYFISYLYNKSMKLPIKINGGPYEVVSLEANIDTNSWAPYNTLPTFKYWRDLDPYVTGDTTLNHSGFLSLRKTKTTVIRYDGGLDANMAVENAKYYYNNKRGHRDYPLDGEGTDEDGKYTVRKVPGKNVWNLEVPLYTRAKQLIIKSAFTGNNPYVAYQRKAVVRFRAKLRQGTEEKIIEENSTIMQVRRVVNPKGIWRNAGDATQKPFHVVLKRLPRESATSFEAFTSEGKWRAFVLYGDKNFVKFNGNLDTVKGSTGSFIDFNIDFKGSCGERENRFAIIRVDYHDYSCEHLIFVRQGKSPMELISGGKKWHACNMRTSTEEAGCPAEEGSMFKFGNWNDPIDAVNNVNDKDPWTNPVPGDFLDHAKDSLVIAGTGLKKCWGDIKNNSTEESFTNTVLNAKGIRVASYDDYQALYDHDDIEFAYGVLYGDDATETLTTLEEVYGHRYDRHGKGYGMRGCFVYNNNSTSLYGGRNLFFPIGASGYGHRKDGKNEDGKRGVVRYALRGGYFPDNLVIYAPLFYDIFMRPGAVYWLESKKPDSPYEPNALGWDINYFSFDFNMMGMYSLYNDTNSDACFVRCVED
ncbi:MAG: DUF4906 domain-containing protein [Odoribacter sp.]|nr:DUF4906 domain-containing protein [Odoribacter sp.]